MLFYYATRDGQSGRIAQRIADRLRERGITASPENLATAAPSPAQLRAAPLLVLVAAIRYGNHLPEARLLLEVYSALSSPPPLVFVSVNLTARKPGKDTPEGNVYLRKTIARYRLRPLAAAAIAGRLDYSLYGWFDRTMIRGIMLLTGGPTDIRARIEYTDWNAVDAFASKVAGLVRHRKAISPAMAQEPDGDEEQQHQSDPDQHEA
jgi:menaquinone-dependent protoporphyrinogen oxidase